MPDSKKAREKRGAAQMTLAEGQYPLLDDRFARTIFIRFPNIKCRHALAGSAGYTSRKK
jgi:hypothetical protein